MEFETYMSACNDTEFILAKDGGYKPSFYIDSYEKFKSRQNEEKKAKEEELASAPNKIRKILMGAIDNRMEIDLGSIHFLAKYDHTSRIFEDINFLNKLQYFDADDVMAIMKTALEYGNLNAIKALNESIFEGKYKDFFTTYFVYLIYEGKWEDYEKILIYFQPVSKLMVAYRKKKEIFDKLGIEYLNFSSEGYSHLQKELISAEKRIIKSYSYDQQDKRRRYYRYLVNEE